MDEEIAQLHPWLVIQDTCDTSNLIWYDVASMKYSKKTITEIENKVIWCSHFGWFILRDTASTNVCLFDPITLEIIGLPPLPKDCGYIRSYILLPPGNPNCHVIFFDKFNKTLFSCKPKDSEYAKQRLEGVEDFWAVGGKGYAVFFDEIALERNLVEVAFECGGSEVDRLKWLITMPSLINHRFSCLFSYDTYLVELGDGLLLVHLLKSDEVQEIDDIMIWKLDFEKRKWIEIDDIGSWTIFISSNIAIAQENSTVQKNAVYFLKRNNERFLRIFNMIDRSFSMILPYPTITQNLTVGWMLMDITHPF